MTEKKFRSSMGGFNRKDVVLYIEQINNEHNNALNQLRSENQSLRQQLEGRNTEELTARVEELEKALEEARAALAEEQGKREEALQKITEMEENAQAQQELEVYRRAEQAERAAKERVEQMYRQATGTLAEATTHVDAAAESFSAIADRLGGQLGELQAAIDSSKNALMDAATVMYTIHLPEE